MIRVVVVARSNLSRAGLESVVRSSESLTLAASLDWSRIGLTNGGLPDGSADVALLDAGEIQAERLRGLASELALPVVLITDTSENELVTGALRAGIRGIVSREATALEIESAIQAAHSGLVVIPSAALPELLPEMRPPAEELAEPLSDREREVLNLMAEGLSNKLIAHSLDISEHTVKTHVASILAKLGASSRTEAVSQAIRRGLLML